MNISKENVNSRRYAMFLGVLDGCEDIIDSAFSDKPRIYTLATRFEFYALVEFFSICVDKTTGRVAPDLMRQMMKEVGDRAIACGLSVSPEISVKEWGEMFNNRVYNYEQLRKKNYIPQGFFLTSEYPRYENEIQDVLMRSVIAFGDFSVFFISSDAPAKSLNDISTEIALDLFDCAMYTSLFKSLSDLIFRYFSLSIETVHSVPNYGDAERDSDKTETPTRKDEQGSENIPYSKRNTVIAEILFGLLIALSVFLFFITCVLPH